ncbi:MAG TPA: MG2 domain-containing protein, partial [Pyrinomonadaceae bacterium]
ARAGSGFRARARAANPVNGRPVKGVAVEGTLAFDAGEGETVLRAAGVTDAEGFAPLDFELPRSFEDDGEVRLVVKARLGSLAQEAETEVSVDVEPRVLLTTDKPLYQPGQTAHMRALVFDASGRALAGEEVTFSVEDEEGATAFGETLKTSRFGVASVDWRVPEGARLGAYTLKLEMEGGRDDAEYGARADFKVSRYDLPNFSVSAKPDRPFYLAGQTPSVEVRADYLFGRPVTRGRVRVVRQTERRWNYREQKYETEERPAVEGDLDEQGRYAARLDVSDAHGEMAASGFERFRDLRFAAYVTDPTTNRTEQRRFSLRLTTEPVHVYVSEGRFRQARGLPLAFYLTTFYADGSPAECDVAVYGAAAGGKKEAALFRTRTNRYGVAKVVGPPVARDESRDNIPLRFVARDREGRGGRHSEDFWLAQQGGGAAEIRVETGKTVYRAGEPVAVTLASDQEGAGVVVDAVSRGRVVFSKAVRLSGGRASLVIPSGEGFDGPVRITATAAAAWAVEGAGFAAGARTVVFPRDRELKLDVALSQKSFRPGDEAGARFALRGADGRGAAGALGVLVFDKAVEERAGADGDAPGPFGFAGALEQFSYGGEEVAGVTRRGVERLDPARPRPEGFETAAEILYNSERYDEGQAVAVGAEFARDQREVFADLIAARLGPLRAALAARFAKTEAPPADEAALVRALAEDGMDFAALRDPWGRPYRTHFFHDGEELTLVVYSGGADERAGTADDFAVADFTSWRAAAGAGAAKASRASAGGAGAISGRLTDPNGAVVPGVSVKATHDVFRLEFEAVTDDEGVYLLRGLPSGPYTVTADSPGFRRYVAPRVWVRSGALTRVDARLDIGAITETVQVTGGELTPLDAKTSRAAGRPPDARLSTPRLREFFPETLVWSPELVTGSDGSASMKFKLADNITTWKMSVIASTEDGRLGAFEQEFIAFQPFFIEHDPPRVLTEGDEISLPVVLRNYLGSAQGVEVEMKPEAWFALGGPARRREEVAAGDAARPAFDFRAVASVRDGRQRVAAYGADASDAVEKPVTVHPDGEERTHTDSAVFAESAALVARVPADAVRDSVGGELKLYPNLSAHLLEGVEAIMRRPHGCGEQTISSTYPSVLVLLHHAKTAGAEPPLVARARGYARLGYERLLGYRAEGGGFTYWGRGEPDLALTAYALRFLTDASRVIEVDAGVVAETRDWLLRQQREDGSWPATRVGRADDGARAALTTAFIARVLAASLKSSPQPATGAQAATDARDKPDAQPSPDARDKPGAQAAPRAQAAPLQRALRYLAPLAERSDEAYLVASYALAAVEAGEAEGAARAVSRLRALARSEGAGSFWELEGETPFHGWGLAGRVETTALAVAALNRYCGLNGADCRLTSYEGRAAADPYADPQSEIRVSRLIDRGLVFLLRAKDRYGVWYSTQATVNVFDALLSTVAAGGGDAAARRQGADAADIAEVFVNGRPAGRLSLPPADRLTGPLALDLTPFLGAGDNRVEIRRPAGARRAQAQLVTSFYTPWPARPARAAGGAGALRLSVAYDRANPGVSEEVTCSVEASRGDARGGGMLLAEVGLPPGADVDRGSLARAMQESGWALSRYDVLPDRLVAYLWPPSGGARFKFKFRPRYQLNALTAPSQLYDYYNPEARAVVPPARFVVR